VTAVTRSDTFSVATSTESDAMPAGDRALLPDPIPSSGGQLDDAMSCIYAVISQLQALDVESTQESVAENKTLQDADLAHEQGALKRQEANEAGSGRGLFSSIGHLVSDVAGDLARGKVGQAISGTGSDIGDAWNSPKFWSDLVKGLRTVSEVAEGIATVARLVPGAGTIVAAAAGAVDEAATAGVTLANVRGAYFAAEVMDAGADAAADQHEVGSLQTEAGWMLDDLKTADGSYGRALDALRGAIKIGDETLRGAASITVRG